MPTANAIACDSAAIDPLFVERELAILFAEYPELAEDAELRADMVKGRPDVADMLQAIVRQEREADAVVAGLTARAAELEVRKARYARRKAAMQTLALRVMKAGGINKQVLAEATVSITVKPAAVEIRDATALPKKFVTVTVTPDVPAIRGALSRGERVRGAKMGKPGKQLSIRV